MPLQRAAAIGLRIPPTAPSRQSSLQSQTTLMRRLLLRPSRPSNRIQRRPISTQSTSSSSSNPSTTTTQVPPPATGTTSTAAAAAEQATTDKTATRLDRILTRTSRYLPERLRAPLRGFRRAPVSHVASFLVLHELTAILPLFGLTGAFYYLDIVPVEWVFGWWAPYVQEEGTKVLRYFKKKGWFGLAAGDARGDKEDLEKGEERLERELAERESGKTKNKGWFAFLGGGGGKGDEKDGGEVEEVAAQAKSKARKAVDAAKAVKGKVTWDNSETGYKLGVQIVAAYAITKMLLIPRVALSLWLTPSFARAMVWSRKLIFRR
ncbi:protein family FLILHELTA [Apiospora marii]|uniref:Protein family FLILHELTA n=1 Tax=Apiospora marii TaxID=335849 RepID=A0ABR1R4S9_9PEZI